MNKYTTLESTIRSLGAKSASQPLEKDMNDQVHAGSYTSKNFEVSKPAQKLFASLPKDADPDKAEKSLQLHDKLFAIHKKTKATGRSTKEDADEAQSLHDKIMSISKEMGIENKMGHVKDSLDFIRKQVDNISDPKPDISPDDVASKFATPPKDYQSDVKADADIDNIAKFKISRDKKAQRKLKIIDDQYIPGVTEMDRIENLSPSFLEALAKVQENEKELEEKKLIGKQKKLDKNHNGKLDADDFKKLRAEEKEESAAHEKAEKKHNNTPAGVECPVCGMKACPTVKEETQEGEQIDEAQFVVIQKGMDKKRIRNNPAEIMKARKEGWAINEDAEIEEATSPLKALGTQQKKATIQREVQQKKAMYAKKDAVDKQKFSKSMQKIHAGDEVAMDKKKVFMEKAIAILGEEYANLSLEQLIEEVKAKKARGRPRTKPLPDPNAPKRPRGRPKKGSTPVSTSTPAKAGSAKPEDTDKDREHIVMGLRKAVSLRGEHHVKFANGESHKISAEHAQKALKMHDSLSRPSEKMTFARKLAASHDSFKKALADKNPGGEEKKKTGITLAKRAD